MRTHEELLAAVHMMHPDHFRTAGRLRAAREHAGISVTGAAMILQAGECDRGPLSVLYAETGIEPASPYQLALWAQAYEVPLDWLKGSDQPCPHPGLDGLSRIYHNVLAISRLSRIGQLPRQWRLLDLYPHGLGGIVRTLQDPVALSELNRKLGELDPPLVLSGAPYGLIVEAGVQNADRLRAERAQRVANFTSIRDWLQDIKYHLLHGAYADPDRMIITYPNPNGAAHADVVVGSFTESGGLVTGFLRGLGGECPPILVISGATIAQVDAAWWEWARDELD